MRRELMIGRDMIKGNSSLFGFFKEKKWLQQDLFIQFIENKSYGKSTNSSQGGLHQFNKITTKLLIRQKQRRMMNVPYLSR